MDSVALFREITLNLTESGLPLEVDGLLAIIVTKYLSIKQCSCYNVLCCVVLFYSCLCYL